MNIEKQPLENHHIKLAIQVEESDWEKAKRLAARQLSKRVKIPGFRPGKAPYNTVLRQVGEGNITQEALEAIIEDTYKQALKEAEIEPYGPGDLEQIEEYDPPVLEFTIPLQPEVELGDYKALDIAYEPPGADEEEIDDIIASMQRQNAVSESVDRPAEEGDIVYMRVSAKRIGVEDDEEASVIDQQFSSARLGQKDSATDHQFFPGFSEHLEGMAADDEKTFTYTYPDDHEDEELQGEEVEFQIVVTSVQGYTLPDLDDEFAQMVSEFDTYAEMRADIQAELEEQAKAQYDLDYQAQVIEKVVAESKLKYPPQVVEDEKAELIAGLEARLEHQGMSKDIYLRLRGQSEEELEEEMDSSALKNARQSMVLLEIAETEKLEPDQDELTETLDSAIEIATEDMTPQEIREAREDGRLAYFSARVIENVVMGETIEYLIAIAKGKPVPNQEEPTRLEEDSEAPEQEPASEEGPTDTVPEAAPSDESDSPPQAVNQESEAA